MTVIANQQHATAAERTRKTSQQYAEGGLDTALTVGQDEDDLTDRRRLAFAG